MEVPESNVPPLPVPTLTENTLTPGAMMLGFRPPSPSLGPPELKDAASW